MTLRSVRCVQLLLASLSGYSARFESFKVPSPLISVWPQVFRQGFNRALRDFLLTLILGVAPSALYLSQAAATTLKL